MGVAAGPDVSRERTVRAKVWVQTPVAVEACKVEAIRGSGIIGSIRTSTSQNDFAISLEGQGGSMRAAVTTPTKRMYNRCFAVRTESGIQFSIGVEARDSKIIAITTVFMQPRSDDLTVRLDGDGIQPLITTAAQSDCDLAA